MAHCFTPIRGRRMRVTKVNALGRPVYGPAAFVVTSGFVSVQFTPEIAEGEETEIRTAGGEICVSERGCDELRWITVQIEFCQVDPCLFTLINETWTELRDCMGEVIGWAESHKFSCDTGFGLELWTDVTGYTPTTPGAQGAWGYMLLPFIIGGTLGEQTVENGAVSFTITGRTKRGSGWGVGPYDVMCNDPETGACGPLLTPVGPEEPRRIFLTTCPPPAVLCGCQPLSAPDGPPLTVAENDAVPGRMGVTASVPAGTAGDFSVTWGDGTAVQDIIPGTPLSHTFARAGTYHISVWDKANTQKITVRTVTVPFTNAQMPTITLTEAAGDPDRMTVSALVDNHGNGPVTLTWGQTPALPDATNPGDGTTATTQKYTQAGTWTVTATDQDNPALTSTAQAEVPFDGGVALTLTVADADPGQPSPRRTAVATWDNQGQGPVKLWWGDEDPVGPGIDKPESGSDTHTYLAANDGQVTVTVTDAANTSRTHSVTVTIPDFPAAFAGQSTGDPSEGQASALANDVDASSSESETGLGSSSGTSRKRSR